jgi:hypothetical protein
MRLRTRRRRPGRQPGSARGVIPGPRLALAAALVLTATLGPTVPCRATGLVIQASYVMAPPRYSENTTLTTVRMTPSASPFHGLGSHAAAV